MPIPSLLIGLGMAGSAVLNPQFGLGPFAITTPAGWHELRRDPGCLVLRSPDQREQAILSLLETGSGDRLRGFDEIRRQRMDAERSALDEGGFILPETPQPTLEGDGLAFAWSGQDRATRRVFSTYMTMVGNDVFILYLEGIDVAPGTQRAELDRMVRNLHHR